MRRLSLRIEQLFSHRRFADLVLTGLDLLSQSFHLVLADLWRAFKRLHGHPKVVRLRRDLQRVGLASAAALVLPHAAEFGALYSMDYSRWIDSHLCVSSAAAGAAVCFESCW